MQLSLENQEYLMPTYLVIFILTDIILIYIVNSLNFKK
jgi:hypothetical protein